MRFSFETHSPSVLVLGAGPAGLAAATAVMRAGVDVLLIDPGKPIWARDRDDPRDLVTGVGGAGAFSDGKFSWYPSASALWDLEDTAGLERSYRWLAELLDGWLVVPQFPVTAAVARGEVATGGVIEKRYDSQVLDLAARVGLVERVFEPVERCTRLGMTIDEIVYDQGRLLVKGSDAAGEHVITPKLLIVAGGRFGNRSTNLDTIVPHAFRRYEVGVRLESPVESFFLQQHDRLDPKFIVLDQAAGVEWRTFCTCRNGEVVATAFRGLTSHSGRADGPKTERSNVGFNLRIKAEPPPGSPLRAEIDAVLNGSLKPFRVGLGDYLCGVGGGLGSELDRLLRDGLSRLPVGPQARDTVVIGPTVEGTGQYPVLDRNLRVPGQRIWFAGDHTGLFRGLTAAFLSGYYAGEKAAGHLVEAAAC